MEFDQKVKKTTFSLTSVVSRTRGQKKSSIPAVSVFQGFVAPILKHLTLCNLILLFYMLKFGQRDLFSL